MTTTLNLDDDIAALLARESTRSGVPLDETVNRLLRSGLKAAEVTQPLAPFVVKPIHAILPQAWTSGSVQELINLLQEAPAE